jgi:hypothetical protein
MKPIAKNELFKNLSGFLKSKGIELTDGSYVKGIQQTCTLLTNAINVGQESLGKAKTELNKTCAQVKQVIHEKTAPTPPQASAPPKQKGRTGAAKTSRPAEKPARPASSKGKKSIR